VGLNFTLSTSLGSLDLLGEVTGAGATRPCCRTARRSKPSGSVFPVDLPTLIRLAAGRPKDLEPIAELEALLEERRRLEASGETPPGG
jgi:hypothetical protein